MKWHAWVLVALTACGGTTETAPEIGAMSPDCVEAMENYVDVSRILLSVIEDNIFSANPITLAEVNERLDEAGDLMDATLPTAEACRESVES